MLDRALECVVTSVAPLAEIDTCTRVSLHRLSPQLATLHRRIDYLWFLFR